MTHRFKGTMVALATPFRDGQLDEEACRRHVNALIEGGVEGLVPIGTTGEAVTMTPAERVRCVRVCVEASAGRSPVLAGAGSNSTAATIEAVAAVRDAGADGSLVVTPYYNKPSQAGLLEHYRQVARAHPGHPLVAYNVPGRTGVELSVETVERLGEISEVVALKEANPSMSRSLTLVERVGGRLTLLSGDDPTLLPFLACGGEGCISVSGNVAPRHLSSLVRAALEGRFEEARRLQLELQPLHRALFLEPNPVPLKWALHRLGRFSDELRAPLVALDAAHRPAVEEAVRALGLT